MLFKLISCWMLGCILLNPKIQCKDYEPPSGPSKEAQEHYDKARDAFIHALGHSALAGSTILECPPVGLYEGYNAVQSWKEMAREYNAYVELENMGTYTRPEPKSSRDD